MIMIMDDNEDEDDNEDDNDNDDEEKKKWVGPKVLSNRYLSLNDFPGGALYRAPAVTGRKKFYLLSDYKKRQNLFFFRSNRLAQYIVEVF